LSDGLTGRILVTLATRRRRRRVLQVIENALVWDGASDVRGATIVIDGGRIAEVSAAPIYRPGVKVERLDAGGRLAIPGLINAHGHAYSALARGMAIPGYSPRSFAEILEQLWWRLDKALDPASVRASSVVAAMDAARCGVTTVIDHHASPSCIPGSLDIVKRAFCDDVGLRVAVAYEVSDRDGAEKARLGIEENIRMLTAPAAPHGEFAALFGLHAAFTLSDETLSAVSSRLPDDAGIHIHVAEGPEDEALSLERHGIRVIDRLDRFGLLRRRSVLAHALHLDEGEKDRVAERGAVVVHNPRSNMNNAVGTFDLDGYLRRGVVAGLGTDGLGANLITELFTAGLLQRQARRDPQAAGFADLYKLLFVNNPEIAERVFGTRLGRIAPGLAADIALLDYDGPTPVDADTILGHLLFGVAVHGLRVSDLFVAGRSVLRDGAFVNVDEASELAHAREQATALWSRVRRGGTS
jgi:putative selenium metabolism protein SsnA